MRTAAAGGESRGFFRAAFYANREGRRRKSWDFPSCVLGKSRKKEAKVAGFSELRFMRTAREGGESRGFFRAAFYANREGRRGRSRVFPGSRVFPATCIGGNPAFTADAPTNGDRRSVLLSLSCGVESDRPPVSGQNEMR